MKSSDCEMALFLPLKREKISEVDHVRANERVGKIEERFGYP